MTNLSNRNTSNRNTLPNSAKHNVDPKSFYGMALDYDEDDSAFSIGDSVLCPMTGEKLQSYVLTADPYKQNDLLALTDAESVYYFDNKGFFVRASCHETTDSIPSLFYDTPANRQAIATLYPCNPQRPTITPLSAKGANRHTIDVTQAEDCEVMLLPSMMLSDTASEVFGAHKVLHDIGQLLGLIYNEKITPNQARSMARLAHDSTDVWADILYCRTEKLNTPLSQSMFGKVEDRL